jgi:regulation of enolase protein 1 (concanavalin A-like superfamily)
MSTGSTAPSSGHSGQKQDACLNPGQREFLALRDLSRRSLLVRFCAAAALVALPNSFPWSAAAAEEAQGADNDLIARMTWLNEPASWKRAGDKLVVRSRPKTDFWRKTFLDSVADNGHFLHLTATGNFVFEARVNGQYSAPFDQAGIMVRLDPENWMKCGTEFFEGYRHASVVFTRDFSDWSLMRDLSDTAPVWWKVVRHLNSIENYCSLDGQNFTLVRSGYFAPSAKAEVGIMCAAPEGNGFECEFDNLKLSAAGK